jgi:hypothetical protein
MACRQIAFAHFLTKILSIANQMKKLLGPVSFRGLTSFSLVVHGETIKCRPAALITCVKQANGVREGASEMPHEAARWIS